MIRHVVPEALTEVKNTILQSVKEIIVQDEIRTLTIPSESEEIMRQFTTRTFSTKRCDDSGYDTTKPVNEILNESADSPKLFVINLPEADVARYFCSK